MTNRTTTESLTDRMLRLAAEWDGIGGIWSMFARDLRNEVAAYEANTPSNVFVTWTSPDA